MDTSYGVKAPVRVLIVDDSNLFRAFLKRAISGENIEIVGSAANTHEARRILASEEVDLITLDLEMPGEDGLTFLRGSLAQCPIPVIVLSGVTQQGAKTAIEALQAGAAEVFGKPRGAIAADVESDEIKQLRQTIRSLGVVRMRRRSRNSAPAVADRPAKRFAPRPVSPVAPAGWVIGIGASTGGVQAIQDVLKDMPADCPPILIVQHMPPGFTTAFSKRLNGLCTIEVREAREGDILQRGVALIAPAGDTHMALSGLQAGQHRVRLEPGDPVCYSRPAVDVLFNSLARHAAPRVAAVVLTGMGADGAEGSLAIRRAGGKTFAQDEATSQIYGMPARTWENGGAIARVPLGSVAETLLGAIAQAASEPSMNHRGIRRLS